MSRFAMMAVATVAMGVGGISARAVPTEIPYVGQLTYASSGTGYTGSVSVQAKLFPTEDGVTPTWTAAEIANVGVYGGSFSFVLRGGAPPLGDAVVGATELWLEVAINGTVLLPRQQLLSVPYAIEANDASALGGLEADAYVLHGDDIEAASITASGTAWLSGALRVGTTAEWSLCDGSLSGAIRYNAVSGTLELCDGAAWRLLLHDGTQITTVSWSNLEDVPAGFADGIDHDTIVTYANGVGLLLDDTTFAIDESYVQRRVASGCPEGQAIVEIHADGSVTCGEAGTALVLSAGGGLALDAEGALSMRRNCQGGQVLQFDGSNWSCATVGGASAMRGILPIFDFRTPFTANVGPYPNTMTEVTGDLALDATVRPGYPLFVDFADYAGVSMVFEATLFHALPAINTCSAQLYDATTGTAVSQVYAVWGSQPTTARSGVFTLSGTGTHRFIVRIGGQFAGQPCAIWRARLILNPTLSFCGGWGQPACP